jgi:hypothetical protein
MAHFCTSIRHICLYALHIGRQTECHGQRGFGNPGIRSGDSGGKQSCEEKQMNGEFHDGNVNRKLLKLRFLALLSIEEAVNAQHSGASVVSSGFWVSGNSEPGNPETGHYLDVLLVDRMILGHFESVSIVS